MLQNTITGVSNTIQKGFTSVIEFTGKSAKFGANGVVVSYEWLGRKVTNLTNSTLPKTLASIVQHIYWTAPSMIPLFILPPVYSYAAKAIIQLLPEDAIRKEFGEERTARFYTGVRNACLIHAACDAVQFATIPNPWSAVSCIANLFWASQAHLAANPQHKRTMPAAQ